MALSECTAEAISHSEAETERLAGALAALLGPDDVVCLYGELGSGKTRFAKGLVAGLGGRAREVTSPTFVLLQMYDARLPVCHFDAYRLRSAQELIDIGSDEMLCRGGVSVIEWSDRVRQALPEVRVEVHLSAVGETERRARFVGRGDHPAACVGELVRRGLLMPG